MLWRSERLLLLSLFTIFARWHTSTSERRAWRFFSAIAKNIQIVYRMLGNLSYKIEKSFRWRRRENERTTKWMNKIGFFSQQFFAIHKTKFGEKKIIFHKTEWIFSSWTYFSSDSSSAPTLSLFTAVIVVDVLIRWKIFSFISLQHTFSERIISLWVMLLKCFSFSASQRKIAAKFQKHSLLLMMNESTKDMFPFLVLFHFSFHNDQTKEIKSVNFRTPIVNNGKQ